MGVGGVWMQGYEEAAAAVPAQGLPLTVVFRRGPVPLRDAHAHHAVAAATAAVAAAAAWERRAGEAGGPGRW